MFGLGSSTDASNCTCIIPGPTLEGPGAVALLVGLGPTINNVIALRYDDVYYAYTLLVPPLKQSTSRMFFPVLYNVNCKCCFVYISEN